jgi:hypothetical protein
MPRARTKTMVVVAVLLLAALASTRADARKPQPKAPPPPTADQQIVVAQVVNQTFPLPKREPLTLALCLDIQIADAIDEDALPPPPPPKRKGRGPRKHPLVPESELPRPPVVRGAPPALVEHLVRPWRLVASASSCRLDPRLPIALPDEHHTAAQLVTVHLAPDAAAGTIKVDWTDARDPTATSSRDCTAARAPTGWAVHCGGVWYQ